MKLYRGNVFKYYNSSRISFFDNLLIRFTQTEDFEDYEECIPEFKFSFDRNIVEKRAIESIQRTNKGISPEQFNALVQQLSNIYIGTAEKTYFSFLQHLGILSLAKSPYNFHLWEKYANDGFCVEFDGSSNFFQEQEADPPGTGVLFEVIYSDTTVELNIDALLIGERNRFLPLDVFYQKKIKWKLEDEVRIIKLRSLANETHEGGRVSLFKIPSSIVKAVYFSQHASEDFVIDCTNRIRRSFSNLPLYKQQDHSFKSF